MAESNRFLLLQDVQTALRAISVAGGYFFDVENDAVSLDPMNQIAAMTGELLYDPFFVIELAPTEDPPLFPSSQLIDELVIRISAATDAEQLEDDGLLKAFTRLTSDIEKAVEVDVTRSGLCSRHTMGGCQMGLIAGTTRVFAVCETNARVHRTHGTQ